eukprot:403366589
MILAVSDEATGDFIFSRRLSGVIRLGGTFKRQQIIDAENHLWFGLHDSSSRAWIMKLTPDGKTQTFYDTGFDFKFTGACLDSSLDRIIFAGVIQEGETNQIAIFDGNSDSTQSSTYVHPTPDNHQIQIEQMIQNGENLFGCVSSYYLTSSNLRHFGIFVRERIGETLGFYYYTEVANLRIYNCLGIHYDSVSNTLTTYVKALISSVPYIYKLVIVDPLMTALVGIDENSNIAYKFLPESGYNFAQIDVMQKNGQIVVAGTVLYSGEKQIGFVTSSLDSISWIDTLDKGEEFQFTAFNSYQSSLYQTNSPSQYDAYPDEIKGGKLKFEIIPINLEFVCLLNIQCPLYIAKATLKGCQDLGNTFTFSQSLQQFNNSTNKFETPTIPIVYSLTTNQYDGVQMRVNETRTDFLFNTYTFRVDLSFFINNTIYETDQSLRYKIYFDHVYMVTSRQAQTSNVKDNVLFYTLGEEKLVVDFTKYIVKVQLISTIPNIVSFNPLKKQISVYTHDNNNLGTYVLELSITYQVSIFSIPLASPFFLNITVITSAFNVPQNTAPYFTTPLVDQTIDVKYGEQIIELPDAKDQEANLIYAEFQYGAASVFVLSSNITTIKLRPLKTHVGIYQIRVMLTDLYPQPKFSKSTFNINVIDTTVYEIPNIQVNEQLNDIYKLQITDVTNEGVVKMKHNSQFKFVSNIQMIRSNKLLELTLQPYEPEYLDKKPIIKNWSVIKVYDNLLANVKTNVIASKCIRTFINSNNSGNTNKYLPQFISKYFNDISLEFGCNIVIDYSYTTFKYIHPWTCY